MITLKQAGSMHIQVPINQTQVSVIILKNIYYYLNMNFSLISQVLLCREGYSFMFTNNICKITLLYNTYIRYIQMTSNLYIIYNDYLLKTMNELTIYDLYKQLGHISYNYIKQLLKEHPNVLKTKVTNYKEKECIECIKANIQCTTILRLQESPLAQTFGNYIYMNIVGPIKLYVYKNICYLLTIVNNATC